MPSPIPEWLCLRPLSGAEADVQLLRSELERDPVRPACFDLPDSTILATQDAARILADALRLLCGEGLVRSVLPPGSHLSLGPTSWFLS
jgi:hypothetical protein